MRNSTIITPDKNIIQLNPKPAFDMKIGAANGKVAIIFSEPLTVAAFTVREALDLASLLIKHAGTLVPVQQETASQDNGKSKIVS